METVTLGEQSQGHEEGLSRINYKSDFPLAVKLVKNGQPVAFPDCDFSIAAKTENGFTVYKVERKNGVCKHCKQDGDRLIVFFDNHGLGKGRIEVECVIDNPDADYTEDGIRQETYKAKAPIVLVDDNGDALDLRLPEPRVVEKVVEKIVEKPVEKTVEKVVEKETDHYTDLQKKAAAWVAGLDTSGDASYPLILDYFFNNIRDVYILTSMFNGGYVNGANETDPDFNEKLILAKACIENFYSSMAIDSCFEGMNAPHLDLELFPQGDGNISSLFKNAIVNTITINARDFYLPGRHINERNIEETYNVAYSTFEGCVAKKVTIYKVLPSAKNVYYYLAAIRNSKVECFEFREEDNSSALDINFVADKLLPDVSQDEHKPKLIFRNVVGTVNEELKQKILAKGYPSVEFYEGENKVL